MEAPFSTATISAYDMAIVWIDQMDAIARRAGHRFIAVIGPWRVGQALHLVAANQAAVKKRICPHPTPIEDGKHNSQLRIFT